jgi:hypothetical protein
MSPRDCFHHLHSKLILVSRDVGCGINRREFVLPGRDFVMLCVRINAEFPQLLIKLFHKRRNPWLYAAEIMVVEFLPFGRRRTEKRSSAVNQVGAFAEHVRINQKILLFCPRLCYHALADRFFAFFVAFVFFGNIREKLQNPQSLLVNRLHRAQERCLRVECLTRV